MNEKIKAWLMRVSPEKIVLVSAAVPLVTSWGLFIAGVVRDSSALRKAGLITFGVAFAAACVPLVGFIISSGIAKLRGK